MSKLLHFFNYIILYCGCFVFFLFFMPSFSVKASDFTEYVNTGSLNISYSPTVNAGYPSGSFGGSPYGCYQYISSEAAFGRTNISCYGIVFNIDSSVNVSSWSGGYGGDSGSYQKTINGVVHTVYWARFYGGYTVMPDQNPPVEYIEVYEGTRIYPDFSLNNTSGTIRVCNYFLFGEGSLDYETPAQYIEDSDLDIVGLIGSFSTSTDTDPSTLSGFMSNFFKNVLNLFSGGLFAGSTGSGNIFSSSVPSCRLVWDSPAISSIADYTDISAVSYSIWIDGSSKINLYQAGEWVDGSSCSFSHLVLHDEPIIYNGVSPFYYSTGSDYQTILNYVLNNSSFSGGTSVSEAQNSDIKLETIISRIYIQAHRFDENGDNHIGSISYVDFSTGYPVVYEGVTGSIDDIVPDDSGNGSNTVVTQPFVVSGDNIIYGDTVTENNTTNNYYGEGLVIGGNIPFLNAAYWLIQAVLELIKTLYASLLVPFIVLGWTGHL